MPSKVRVYGKAQNRTALGIVHAYMIMYPHATFEDLQKAFPDSLTHHPHLFITPEMIQNDPNYVNWCFAEKDELITTADKVKLALIKVWTKPEYDRLVEHAKQYDIEVAEFEKGVKGQKGGFRLEYLNGYIPPVPQQTKKSVPAWLWAVIGLLAAAVVGLILWLSLGKKQVVEVEKVVVVHDTLYIQQLHEIERNFNAAEFAQGKSELSEDAKFVLHDLAKLMQENPELKLEIEGHTSAEGDAAANQQLSEARAQAAVAFLVEREDIDASRLTAIGRGSSEPKNADDPYAPENRRTEFVIVE